MDSNPFELASLLGPKSTKLFADNSKPTPLLGKGASSPESDETPEQTTAANQAASAAANADLTNAPAPAMPQAPGTPADAAAMHAYVAAHPQMALHNLAPIPALARALFGKYGGPLSWLMSKAPPEAQSEGLIPYAADGAADAIGGAADSVTNLMGGS